MVDPTVRAWRMLLTVHAELVELLSREMAEECDGLALTWYEVLLLLHEAQGPLRMHELADSLLLSRSAATRLVDRIARAGLVVREPAADDRRGVLVDLTTRGREVFAEAAPRHLAGIRRHFSTYIREGEADVIAEAFERVIAAAREA